jgi:hypothetical protein
MVLAMEDTTIHFSYHVVAGRLVKMSDEDLFKALFDRVKHLIKKKIGVNDILNQGNLYGFCPDEAPQILNLEQLICVALDLGITEKELQTDLSLFHVIGTNEVNHTFCIHDFETNSKDIYSDFAKIIIDIFDLEQGCVAPVMLSDCHESYLNEGIIFVHNDAKLGPTAQAIERQNPVYEEVLIHYS